MADSSAVSTLQAHGIWVSKKRGPLYLLGISREYGFILYRDYIGIIFPNSLLTISKFRGNVKGVETRG